MNGKKIFYSILPVVAGAVAAFFVSRLVKKLAGTMEEKAREYEENTEEGSEKIGAKLNNLSEDDN